MADTTSSSAPSRSPVLIIVVFVALAGLIGLNAMSAQFRPKSDEEMQKEAQDKQAAAAKAQPSPSPGTASPGTAAAATSDLVTLSPAGTLGSASAPKEVVVGFEWTPQVQANPSSVFASIEMLQKALPNGRIRVVNADQDPTVPLGISVGGKVVIPAGADGTIPLPPPAVGAIVGMVSAPGGPPPGAGAPPGPPPGAPGAPSAPGVK